MDAVSLRGVTKLYGSTRALDELTVSFPAARLSGFLGPNGSGKTTSFRSILGLTKPQEGEIDVLGMRVGPDTPKIVKRIGAVVEEPGLHKTLSGRDNLRVAALTLDAGHDQIDDLLEFVSLTDVAGRQAGQYSKGMRQRLALAMAMLGDPDVLILDEPLDGLDPSGQRTLREQLRLLVTERGKTVIVSSHDLADIETLADHVVIIRKGRQVLAGDLSDLLAGSGGFVVDVGDAVRAGDVLRAAGMEVDVREGSLHVAVEDGESISRTLAGAGLYPKSLVPERTSLESVFLDQTGGDSA